MDAVSAKARRDDSLGNNPKSENFNVPLMRNDQIIERPANQNTLTKRYTEEAIRFIKENKKNPFFIYFPHTFPHVPLFASEKFKGASRRGLYGDAVEEIDWSVGQIIDTLRKEKLAENTLVIFTSDNGPWLAMQINGGSGGLVRDGKAGTWEGGHRVPAIAYWPGRIKPGRVTSEIVNAMDLFTTALILGGAEIPKDRPIDGVDMSPVLFGTGNSLRNLQFYYYGDLLYAVRKGLFKAHFTTHDGYSKEPPVKHDPPLLHQLAQDPSETVNVAKEHPDIVADLVSAAEKHRASVAPGKQQY
jgi:arylsulfatase A-like enzyme